MCSVNHPTVWDRLEEVEGKLNAEVKKKADAEVKRKVEIDSLVVEVERLAVEDARRTGEELMRREEEKNKKKKKNKMGESVEEHAGAREAEEKWKEEVEARVKVIELESQKTSEFIQKGIEMCKNQEERPR